MVMLFQPAEERLIICQTPYMQSSSLVHILGIQTAIDLGIGHLIIVESDSLKAVRAINSDVDFYDTAVGHLVEEIKSFVSSSFLSFVSVISPRASYSRSLVHQGGRANYKLFA